ncbi:hypothetical protein [Longimicrobium sp.]|uniref:hypothetical protein n=1 Tax=Longimicrobium sp. TaxID=2029185 RepID=UPI002BC2B1A2|nr:hypothetical protein [Longimicrobium sp.]HSU15855.1 hypothetical protein [Longimicrobium sp.]
MNDLIPLVTILGSFLIVLIPVAGLTARFALKPLIESVTRALQARQGGDAAAAERRLARVEEELAALRAEIRKLGDGRDFDRSLAASGADAAAGEG